VEAARTQVQRIVDGRLLDDMSAWIDAESRVFRPRSAAGRASVMSAVDRSGTAWAPTTDADIAFVSSAYDGAVLYADAWVGVLLSELESRRLLDHVVVVIFGDHGEALGEDGTFSHCCEAGDSVTHVPLIVRLPGGERGGRRVDALVELVDVMPTLLELAGASSPAGSQGTSLLPAMRGEPFPGRSVAWTAAADGMTMITGRTMEGRITYSGVPAWWPALPDLIESAALPGPGITTEGLTPEAASRLRQEMVRHLRSMKRTMPGPPAGLTSPELKEALGKHGYWNVGP